MRIVLSIALMNNWTVRQLDVQKAFLHGILDEEVYMKQLSGFVDSNQPTYVCCLHKSIYGLKQAPRTWYFRISSYLLSLGFQISKANNSLLIRRDQALTDSDINNTNILLQQLHSTFAIKDLGSIHYFLGIEVVLSPNGLFLSQQKYIHEILSKTKLEGVKPVNTPLAANFATLEPDTLSKYCRCLTILQYLTFTHLDIYVAVNKNSPLSEKHNQLCLHLIRPKSIQLHAYSDNRRSTGVSWRILAINLYHGARGKKRSSSLQAQKQNIKASQMLHLRSFEIIWIQSLLTKLGFLTSILTLWCDNLGATYLKQTQSFMLHIEVDYHFVHERVSKKKMHIRFVSTKDQLADIFTKGQGYPRFKILRDKLN
ncbi:LOW QUALITY PROTEIN: hypothetical protein OSB04_023822, partial [Centaurea solstitialis]